MELGATRIIIYVVADAIHQVMQVNDDESFAKLFQAFEVVTIIIAELSDCVLETNSFLSNAYNHRTTTAKQ